MSAENRITPDTETTLLLCSMLGTRGTMVRPLTPAEYKGLVAVLQQHRQPVHALCDDASLSELVEEQTRDTKKPVTADRIRALLNRGAALGFVASHWADYGIGVVGQSDEAYPKRWLERLDAKAPSLMFYAGNPDLTENGGMGFVGSRNVSDDSEAAVKHIAAACVAAGKQIVSGGARGVDRIAMETGCACGGTVVGVLANDLQKAVMEPSNRRALADGRACLCSPFDPAAHFEVAKAMGRNKLIYSLADAVLVAQSDFQKGGTWTGAVEELKRDDARPIFVYMGVNPPKGNRGLLSLGGIEWLPEASVEERWDYVTGEKTVCRMEQDCFDFSAGSDTAPRDFVQSQEPSVPEISVSSATQPSADASDGTDLIPSSEAEPILYTLMPRILDVLGTETTEEELRAALDPRKDIAPKSWRRWLTLLETRGQIRSIPDMRGRKSHVTYVCC